LYSWRERRDRGGENEVGEVQRGGQEQKTTASPCFSSLLLSPHPTSSGLLFPVQAVALEADDDGMPVLLEEEEDDGEQWQERIIELNRVTKVVKGGKIMGFRCTALVGNR
jgi:hypothetical protein